MHTVNRTFSIPVDVDRDLHLFIEKRGMSRFIGNAIRQALKAKRESLRKAYRMANKDEGQKEAYKDFEGTMSDGLGETNEW